MRKIIIAVFAILFLPACSPAVSNPTPDLSYLDEELVVEAYATACAKEARTMPEELSLVELTDGAQTFLAFWFTWTDETILLPLTENITGDIERISCQLDANLALGKLFPGFIILGSE